MKGFFTSIIELKIGLSWLSTSGMNAISWELKSVGFLKNQITIYTLCLAI